MREVESPRGKSRGGAELACNTGISGNHRAGSWSHSGHRVAASGWRRFRQHGPARQCSLQVLESRLPRATASYSTRNYWFDPVIEGFSKLDATYLEPGEKAGEKQPVFAAFSARPSVLNGRIFSSLGEFSGSQSLRIRVNRGVSAADRDCCIGYRNRADARDHQRGRRTVSTPRKMCKKAI